MCLSARLRRGHHRRAPPTAQDSAEKGRDVPGSLPGHWQNLSATKTLLWQPLPFGEAPPNCEAAAHRRGRPRPPGQAGVRTPDSAGCSPPKCPPSPSASVPSVSVLRWLLRDPSPHASLLALPSQHPVALTWGRSSRAHIWPLQRPHPSAVSPTPCAPASPEGSQRHRDSGQARRLSVARVCTSNDLTYFLVALPLPRLCPCPGTTPRAQHRSRTRGPSRRHGTEGLH